MAASSTVVGNKLIGMSWKIMSIGSNFAYRSCSTRLGKKSHRWQAATTLLLRLARTLGPQQGARPAWNIAEN